MPMINGMSPAKRNALCKICGAKLRKSMGKDICPNVERKDHQGENK